MQAINVAVFRWIFMTLFLGMAGVSLLLVSFGLFGLQTALADWWIGVGLIYLLRCVAVTVFFNVPLNEALAKMPAEQSETQHYWQQIYVPRWSIWNSIRATACVAASVVMLIGGSVADRGGILR